MDTSKLVPVLLGTDILAYSYARSFHDLYSVTSICVSSVDMKYTSSSRYTDVRIVPDIDDDLCLMDNLVKLSHECSDKELIVLGSGDWYARYLSKHKDYLEGRSASTVINGKEYSKELGAKYCVPYIGFELLDEITQKERFYEMCEEKGVDYPATCVFQCAPDKRADHVSVPFNYPVIAKPSNSAEYHYVEFDGKQKIFSIDSEEELNRVYSNLCDSGYTHSLIVQDNIPGDDSSLYSLTCFVVNGDIKQWCLGRVILQDRSPQAIGNPVCIKGCAHDANVPTENIVWQAQQLLEGLPYDGYANFDLKFDSRDGKFRFLEVNTRPGRNTYYVELAGEPFVKPIVEHFMEHKPVEEKVNDRPFLYKLVPDTVIRKYVEKPLSVDVISMCRQNLAKSPLFNKHDTLAHNFWSYLSYLNFIRKFKTYGAV